MQICITQRDGVRYFSRFRNIPERDKLEVELTVEGDRPRVYSFDLTEILLERFREHPEIFHRKRVVEPDPLFPKRATRTRKSARAPKARVELELTPEPLVDAVAEANPEPAAVVETPKKRVPKRPRVVEVAAEARSAVEAPVAKPKAKSAAKKSAPALPKTNGSRKPAAETAPKPVKKAQVRKPEVAVAIIEQPKPTRARKTAEPKPTVAPKATAAPKKPTKPARKPVKAAKKEEGPKAKVVATAKVAKPATKSKRGAAEAEARPSKPKTPPVKTPARLRAVAKA
jgi:hypothetical protein